MKNSEILILFLMIYLKNFLLTGDNFIPELHLKQPEFIYSACGPMWNLKTIFENILQWLSVMKL